MKKLLQQIGLIDPEPPAECRQTVRRTQQDVNMGEFAKWCKEHNVSTLARNPEFTVIIGNKIKYVTLDQ